MIVSRSILLFAVGTIALAARACELYAAASPASRLAFKQTADGLPFDTGELKGTLGAKGKALGLTPVTHTATGAPIAGPFGLLSPYRLLTSDARFGTAAWDWASQAEVLPDGAARIQWSPDKEHPLLLTAVYRWSAADTIDLELTVKPQRDLPKFELFLASYFNGFPAALCYAKQAAGTSDARFLEAVKAGGDWQTFARDDAATALFGDGRWARPPHPVAWKQVARYAAPLAVRRDDKTGLTAVVMSRPDDCFAVSMPYGEEAHRSVYLSLFGRDLTADSAASAAVRLVVGKDLSDERTVRLYRAYLKR